MDEWLSFNEYQTDEYEIWDGDQAEHAWQDDNFGCFKSEILFFVFLVVHLL